MKESTMITSMLLVYVIISLILIVMDYWNPEQVSHYLGLDLIYGIIPATIYGVALTILNNRKENNLEDLKCDQNSCICGTKECVFWKSLENDKENKTPVKIKSVEWCKTCEKCGFPIVENTCVCSKSNMEQVQ